MRVLRLRGNHFQMGIQHGQQVLDLRPLIVAAVDKRLGALEGRPVADLLAELEQAWAGQAGATLDMLAGMAQALDLDAARLFQYAAASYVEDRLLAGTGPERGAEGCTVWGASGPGTVDRAPILAKNRDYSLAHVPLQALALATPDRGYRYLYVTSAGSPAVFSSGMNEQGLAIADTHVPSSDLGPGLARYSLMMELLEGQTSVASALEYLKGVPRMGAGNLILVDAEGEMAVFEAGHRHWGIVPPVGHLVAATNHYVTPALRDHYLGGDGGTTDDESENRLRSVQTRLRESWGGLDSARARRLMASHADGEVAICRHDLSDASGTISNVIFLPAERSLLFCNGRPCAAEYARYSI